MVTFAEFVDYVKTNILDGWLPEEDYQVSVMPVKKNNGCELTGLSVSRGKQKLVHLIYLEDFYDSYRKFGISPERILAGIREEYGRNMGAGPMREPDIENFDRIKDKIIYRLVNYEKNRPVLKDCPCVRIADLALTFRLLMWQEEPCIASVLISQKMMESWGVDMADLLRYSHENTRRLFPPLIMEMGDLAGWLFRDGGSIREEDLYGPPVYILTNESKINGASVLLYDNYLRDFADSKKMDFYVIPSSIHEFLLLPAEGGIPEQDRLRKIIREVNREVVSDEDYLSDSLYIYERKTESIRIL